MLSGRAIGHRATRQILIFIVVVIAGLTWVKWVPYTDRLLSGNLFFGSSLLLPAPLDFAFRYFQSVWLAVALGLVLAASIEALLPRAWLQRLLGRRKRSAALGGVLSLPCMLCSCCAAPVAASVRRSGATVGASLAFWVGNPMLNPAVLAFLALAIDWRYAALRAVAGALLVFALCPLVGAMVGDTDAAILRRPPQDQAPARTWLGAMARYARTLLPEYVVLVLAVGFLRAWFVPVVPNGLGNDSLALSTAAVAGTLFVIPTAAEIPIVQGLRALGLGAGPAAALIVTLPALSLPSVAMLWRVLPWRALVAMMGATTLVGLLAGIAAILLAFP